MILRMDQAVHKVVNDSWSEAKGVLIIEIFVNIVMDYQLST
jgi:hypothetical protein